MKPDVTASAGAAPLTTLGEEEQMFRDAVHDFADSEVRPHVAAMDQAAALDPALLPKLFQLDLMGIEIPETYGGAGGGLFMTTLAVEELSAVDASAAILLGRQNTLLLEPFLQGGTGGQKPRSLPPPARETRGPAPR